MERVFSVAPCLKVKVEKRNERRIDGWRKGRGERVEVVKNERRKEKRKEEQKGSDKYRGF
jgi:hypothetical protein